MTASPPLRLDIDLDALAANWRWFANASGVSCGAAIKADAYGLGANAVAERLTREGCDVFYVTTWAEADALKIDPAKIRILHGLRAEDAEAARTSAAVPVLNSPEQMALWREIAPGRPCDIMIDTGMNRLGLDWRTFDVDWLNGLNVNTVHSHLACADAPDNPMNREQLQRFSNILAALPDTRGSISGSGGICLGKDYALDHVRPGLGLYGGTPNPAAAGKLKQVLRPAAQIIQVRTVLAGDTVGYGATWQAERAADVAVLNLGYADGFLRGFDGKLTLYIDGKICPVIGRVSMDLIAAELHADSTARAGDWAQLDYDLAATAERTGLSQYELLTLLGARYERHYHE